jgi:hypothetical protein
VAGEPAGATGRTVVIADDDVLLREEIASHRVPSRRKRGLSSTITQRSDMIVAASQRNGLASTGG